MKSHCQPHGHKKANLISAIRKIDFKPTFSQFLILSSQQICIVQNTLPKIHRKLKNVRLLPKCNYDRIVIFSTLLLNKLIYLLNIKTTYLYCTCVIFVIIGRLWSIVIILINVKLNK